MMNNLLMTFTYTEAFDTHCDKIIESCQNRG